MLILQMHPEAFVHSACTAVASSAGWSVEQQLDVAILATGTLLSLAMWLVCCTVRCKRYDAFLYHEFVSRMNTTMSCS
jgi:hypothetical protein